MVKQSRESERKYHIRLRKSLQISCFTSTDVRVGQYGKTFDNSFFSILNDIDLSRLRLPNPNQCLDLPEAISWFLL